MDTSHVTDLPSDDPDLVETLAPQTALAGGNYVIKRMVGRGGFGITYLAHDTSLERDVVVKECFPELICTRSGQNVVATSRETQTQFAKCLEMFMREARSIARLIHPNIVKVHAVFEQNQTAYMVLDFVEGDDLLNILDDPDQTLSVDQVMTIAEQVLQALSVVHENNMLHRDISPDNILLNRQGQPVLIDFGSAKELASDRAHPKTAFLFVKDGYSPFEFYVRGAAHSPASDLYALGGTLYHLVSGEAPPDSQFRHVEINAGRPDPYVPLHGRFPGYTPVFLAAIDKALSLRTTERFQFAEDWHDIITQEVDETPVATPQPRGSGQTVLRGLVDEANREVVGAGAQAADSAAMLRLNTDTERRRPAWRDEFNQETQEIEAQEAARRANPLGDDDAIEETPAPPQKLKSSSGGAVAGMPDLAEKEREDELVALYIQQKKKQKQKRRAKREFKRVAFLWGFGAAAVTLAVYIAVNYERMRDDGTWEALFSSEGLCQNETIRAISPVRVNCEDRGKPRQLDLNSRDRILQLDNDSQFELGN